VLREGHAVIIGNYDIVFVMGIGIDGIIGIVVSIFAHPGIWFAGVGARWLVGGRALGCLG